MLTQSFLMISLLLSYVYTIFLRLTAQTPNKRSSPLFLKNIARGKPKDIIFWPSRPPQPPPTNVCFLTYQVGPSQSTY